MINPATALTALGMIAFVAIYFGLAVPGMRRTVRAEQEARRRETHIPDRAPYRCDVCTFDFPLSNMHFDTDGLARCDSCEENRFTVDL